MTEQEKHERLFAQLNFITQYGHVEGFINETTLRDIVPVSSTALNNLKKLGIIPPIKLPGSQGAIYHWPTVRDNALHYQRAHPPKP